MAGTSDIIAKYKYSTSAVPWTCIVYTLTAILRSGFKLLLTLYYITFLWYLATCTVYTTCASGVFVPTAEAEMSPP